MAMLTLKCILPLIVKNVNWVVIVFCKYMDCLHRWGAKKIIEKDQTLYQSWSFFFFQTKTLFDLVNHFFRKIKLSIDTGTTYYCRHLFSFIKTKKEHCKYLRS